MSGQADGNRQLVDKVLKESSPKDLLDNRILYFRYSLLHHIKLYSLEL